MRSLRLNRGTMTIIRPLLGLVLITGAIALFAPTFRSWPAFSNVLENASVLFIMCTGQTRTFSDHPPSEKRTGRQLYLYLPSLCRSG